MKMIKKTKSGYEVISHTTGRSFGKYKTRKEAETRLQQLKIYKNIRKERIKRALYHPDTYGSGAKRRDELNLSPSEEFEVIMLEFKRGTLFSGSGARVKSIPEAKAIAISELKRRALRRKKK
jgi:hypothetical protein